MTGGRPTVFAHVLVHFSSASPPEHSSPKDSAPRRTESPPLDFPALAALRPHLLFRPAHHRPTLHQSSTLGLVFTHFIVAATSFSLGSIFPSSATSATDPGQSGRPGRLAPLSANIIGAVLGPLLTGLC